MHTNVVKKCQGKWLCKKNHFLKLRQNSLRCILKQILKVNTENTDSKHFSAAKMCYFNPTIIAATSCLKCRSCLFGFVLGVHQSIVYSAGLETTWFVSNVAQNALLRLSKTINGAEVLFDQIGIGIFQNLPLMWLRSSCCWPKVFFWTLTS